MQLPKAMDLLRQSWQMFQEKMKILVLIELVPFLAAIPILIVAGISPRGSAAGPLFFVVTIALAVFGLVLQIWSQISMILAIDNPILTQDFKQIFTQARPMIVPFLLSSLLVLLIVAGGMILLIIPGIIFGFWYFLTGFTVVLEGKRGMEALRASKSYIQGNVGAVFGRIFVLGLTFVLAIWVPIGILNLLRLSALGQLYNLVAALVITPVSSIYIYLIYRHLREAVQFSPPREGETKEGIIAA